MRIRERVWGRDYARAPAPRAPPVPTPLCNTRARDWDRYTHCSSRTESFPSVVVGWVAPLVCVADKLDVHTWLIYNSRCFFCVMLGWVVASRSHAFTPRRHPCIFLWRTLYGLVSVYAKVYEKHFDCIPRAHAHVAPLCFRDSAKVSWGAGGTCRILCPPESSLVPRPLPLI